MLLSSADLSIGLELVDVVAVLFTAADEAAPFSKFRYYKRINLRINHVSNIIMYIFTIKNFISSRVNNISMFVYYIIIF